MSEEVREQNGLGLGGREPGEGDGLTYVRRIRLAEVEASSLSVSFWGDLWPLLNPPCPD